MLVSGHSKELYEFLLQEQGQAVDPGESIPSLKVTHTLSINGRLEAEV